MTTYTTGLLCPVCLQLTADRDLEPCTRCQEDRLTNYVPKKG